MNIHERSKIMSEVLYLNNQGLIQSQIATRVGVPQPTIGRWLCARGIHGPNYNYYTEVTPHQQNVLVGTMLGDGHLGLDSSGNQTNPNLQWSHGPKQVKYLKWKAEQFGPLFTHTEPHSYVKKDGNIGFHISSRCHPLLKPYHDLFYFRPDSECTKHIHKKRITPEILDRVTDQALAIWWCDDGSMDRPSLYNPNRRDAAKMVLGALTETEYELIETWFCDQGYKTTRNKWLTNGENCVTILFSADSTESFMSHILPHVPPCMQFKLSSFGCMP